MAKQKHGSMASEIMVRCVDGMKILNQEEIDEGIDSFENNGHAFDKH